MSKLYKMYVKIVCQICMSNLYKIYVKFMSNLCQIQSLKLQCIDYLVAARKIPYTVYMSRTNDWQTVYFQEILARRTAGADRSSSYRGFHHNLHSNLCKINVKFVQDISNLCQIIGKFVNLECQFLVKYKQILYVFDKKVPFHMFAF